MKLKLIKTYLSQRPDSNSFLVGIMSLAALTLFFGADKETFSANGFLVFEKQQYWRAFTTSLLHADLKHLASNAFFFTGLAALLHHYFGFWIFPFLSLIVGGLINLLALALYPPEVHLVGISGVIYFMASFWLTLYVLIERRQKLLTRFLHAGAVTLIFLFPQVFDPSTSYLVHGLGFVIGVPAGLFYFSSFRQKILSQDRWEIIEDEHKEMENITLLEENSYHLVPPEASGPSPHASDSAQLRSP